MPPARHRQRPPRRRLLPGTRSSATAAATSAAPTAAAATAPAASTNAVGELQGVIPQRQFLRWDVGGSIGWRNWMVFLP